MSQRNAADYFARLRQPNRPRDAANLPLGQFTDLFLTAKQAENKSASYIRELRRILDRFHAFLAEALGRRPFLSDFSLEAGRAFLLYEQERVKWSDHPIHGKTPGREAVSAQTVQNTIRMLKVFASWLDQDEWTRDAQGQPCNVLARLALPKVEKKEVQPLTREEEAKIAKACDDRTRDGCRRLALVLVYLDTGARLNEIVGLRVQDVDFATGRVHIRWQMAKGRKERTVEFGRKTEQALKRYGMIFRDPPLTEARPDDAFFLNPHGEPITGQGVYLVIKRLARRTGIARLHPHLFRHTSGTRDIERGKSTREVQNKLGHSSVTVTERYTHIVERETANRRRDSHIDELPISVRRGREQR